VSLSLKSGIVNPAIMTTLEFDATSTGKLLPLANEIIHFAVIENAARDITTGNLFPFTMGYNLKGNMAFWPKATNAITNNLFRGMVHDGRTYDKPDHFAPHLKTIAHLPEVRMTSKLG